MIKDGSKILVFKATNVPVEVGEVVDSHKETYTVLGGAAPKHEASSGRVYVRPTGSAIQCELYPHVFGMVWLPMEAWEQDMNWDEYFKR